MIKFMKFPYAAFIILVGLIIVSCKEFLEESIADRQMILLSPGREAQIANYSVDFIWEHMEDALAYRLQVVGPDFRDVNLYYADTVVEDNHFTLSLAPGEYEWRVKGLNGSSESAYTTRSFIVYESDLSKQIVLLNSPGDKHITAKPEINFNWQILYGSTAYRLQIDTNNFTGDSAMYDQLIETSNMSYTLPKEREYQWRVRAESDTSQSQWSATRSLIYDATSPAAPQPKAPANNASVSSPVTIQWDPVADAESYQLYVYKSDSTTLYSDVYPLSLTETSHSFSAGAVGETLLWRIRAKDQAGNTSDYSPYRSFMIQ